MGREINFVKDFANQCIYEYIIKIIPHLFMEMFQFIKELRKDFKLNVLNDLEDRFTF